MCVCVVCLCVDLWTLGSRAHKTENLTKKPQLIFIEDKLPFDKNDSVNRF